MRLFVALSLVFCVPVVLADSAMLSQQLLVDSGESAQDIADNFSRRLSDDLDFNRPPAVFRAAADDPLGFLRPAEALSERLVDVDLVSALDEWAAQYDFEPGCLAGSSEPPVSLEQAADSLLVYAPMAWVNHRAVLSERDGERLARDFDRVAAYLENPQPSNLSWGERRRLRRFLSRLDEADLGKLYCATHMILPLLDSAWLATVERLMAEHPRAEEDVIYQRETPMGRIIFAGRADSTHRGDDVLALFDLGGNDIHAIESPGHFNFRPQLLVDFAGNDRYESTGPGGIAGAVGRISLLLDVSGDDVYLSHSFTQGSAVLGVAMLHDMAGNDQYDARLFGQGMALVGVGLLRDDAGNDRYDLFALGQGLGMFAGIGLLTDSVGDDDYRALGGSATLYGDPGLADAWAQGVGLGLRGMASGGVGLLVDGDGADIYDAGAFAQGGGYYRAAGMLLDRGDGDDEFTATRYGLGWGAHGGLGFLDNESGDDRYRTRHSVIAGLAWDYSLAGFRDRDGDDDYRVGDFSLGASAHGSVTWFIDESGSDTYTGTRPARRNEGGPNFSLFLDEGAGDNQLDGRRPEPGCRYSDDHGFEIWSDGGALPECIAQ